MEAATYFSSRVLVARPAFLPSRRTCQLEQRNVSQQSFFGRRQAAEKLFHDLRMYPVIKSTRNPNLRSLNSPSHAIEQFYICINNKNLKQLSDYLADDCCFEDCAFPKTLQGKKEIMRFFELLTASMGPNVKFHIKHVCEGDDFTAGINWHLEWKRAQIPFTRGCSFFEYSEDTDVLTIRKAEVMVESPIKLGVIALVILKTMASLFDEFPQTAEWFLKSPHVILQYLLKIYSILLVPFIKPLLEGYIKIWELCSQLIVHTVKFFIYISKSFLK